MSIKHIDVSDTSRPGAVTVKQANATITAISKAGSAVVTAVNDFAINDVVAFASVAGMTEINGLTGTISAASASSFTVNIASTGFTTYTSGGVASKIIDTPSVSQIRVVYDDTVGKQKLFDALQRAKEAIAELE